MKKPNIRKWLCNLLKCKQMDCTEEIASEVKKAQEDCNQIIRTREGTLKIKHALEMDKLTKEITKWKKQYEDCMGDKPDPPDPPPTPPISKAIKSLEVRDGKFWVNGKATVLIGCSRWEALARAKKIWYDWGTKSFEWYEEQLIKSGINYVRHGIIPDNEFIRQHCKHMGENGIIVKLTIHNSQIEYWLGNPLSAVDATIDLPNVFYDVHNEFLDKEADIQKARELIGYIRNCGGICSAGAWGHSPNGRAYSERFDPTHSLNQVISVHREWTKDWITRYVGHGKPVDRDEYFDKGVLGLEGTKQIMKDTIEAGGQACQYYGFRDRAILPHFTNPDLESWDKYLNWIGNYCKKINGV